MFFLITTMTALAHVSIQVSDTNRIKSMPSVAGRRQYYQQVVGIDIQSLPRDQEQDREMNIKVRKLKLRNEYRSESQWDFDTQFSTWFIEKTANKYVLLSS